MIATCSIVEQIFAYINNRYHPILAIVSVSNDRRQDIQDLSSPCETKTDDPQFRPSIQEMIALTLLIPCHSRIKCVQKMPTYEVIFQAPPRAGNPW